MLTDRLLIFYSVAILVVAGAGLVARGRVADCRSFFVYLLAAFMVIGLEVPLPAVFADYAIYSMKETVLVLLKVAIAIEIWRHSFSSLPRARRRVGILLSLVLLATAAAGLILPEGLRPYVALMGVVHPRQQAGTMVLYAVLVSGAWWYRVPLHPLHRAVLVGFTVYLAVSVFAHSFLGVQAGSVWAYRLGNTLDLLTYSATVTWWAWAAWRPVHAPTPVISRLHPWAQTW